jgi:site-specific DNA recombinase
MDAYQSGIIELEELRERRGCIGENSRLLRDRLQEIQARRVNREQELRLLEGLDTFCDGIRGALDGPTFDLKQRILRLVVDRIIVEDDRVVIRHIIPIPSEGSVSIATGTAS